MGLATVIRMEFAYPGVGVLAGDSIQYLSLATAHGVIMVFFMIMPTLFGAFGNFLLPTQLGVHDVAFPRLNSAAFWFLPGGLIMLLHLVCIDRRYQRMNCFSIRELQSILKKRFFEDLVISHDYHTLLNNSVINLRYKLNGNGALTSDILNFHQFGPTSNIKVKSLEVYPTYTPYSVPVLVTGSVGFTQYLNQLREYMETVLVNYDFSSVYVIYDYLYNVVDRIVLDITSYIPGYDKFTKDGYLPQPSLADIIEVCKSYVSQLGIYESVSDFSNLYSNHLGSAFKSRVVSGTLVPESSSLEFTDSIRFLRYHNPLITYGFKSGQYFRMWESVYPSVLTSRTEISTSLRPNSWFFSGDFSKVWLAQWKNILPLFNPTNSTSVELGRSSSAFIDNIYEQGPTRVEPIFTYCNYIGSNMDTTLINSR